MNKTWTLPTNEEFLREYAPELLEFQNGPTTRIAAAPPTIFNFVLDVSHSTQEYHQQMFDTFNQIMIPAIQSEQSYQLGTLLVGGILFSDKLIPLWPGFKPVKDLSPNTLLLKQLNSAGLRSQTALYRAMLAGLFLTRQAMNEFKHSHPGKVFVLTDGANNREPLDATLVRQTLEQLAPPKPPRNHRKIQCTLAFLKTDQGLTESAARQMALTTGFEFSGFYDLTQDGNCRDYPQRRFLDYLGFFEHAMTSRFR